LGEIVLQKPLGLWAAIAVALTAVPVFAIDESDFEYRTTSNLYNICSSVPENPKHESTVLACRAFIEAAVQYHDAVSDRKQMKRLICYPNTATIEDGRAAFVAWAAKHSNDAERMGEAPVVGLVRSLADKYPCKR
jgi:hypothetical protein